MARYVKRSLCAGEGSGRPAPSGHHAARAQLMGCGLGDNEKEISAQHCPGRTGLCADDPVGHEELRYPLDLEQWDHRQLPGGTWR